MAVLFKGRFGANQTISSVKEFLIDRPTNLYTTMRLVGRTGKVFALDMHLERIRADQVDRETITRMIQELADQNIESGSKDLRITLIRGSEGGRDAIELIYEEMLTTLQLQKGCQVEIRLGARHNVEEKSSQWVKDRKALEDLMLFESNEVILCDHDGRLYEGLSSNFFVIRGDGRLQTAPPSEVLMGTVMKRVIEIECEEGIVFKHPLIEEIDEWQGAFITSTSRLILPIDRIILIDSGKGKRVMKQIPLNEKVQEMREMFEKEML